MVGTVTGAEYPALRVNQTVERFRRVGVRIVLPAVWFAVRGRGYRLTGSGVRAAGPLIILSQIGEVRPGAGVIRSQPVLSPSGSGFSPPYEISYRGLKLPRVSAAFGVLLPAAWGRFVAGGPNTVGLTVYRHSPDNLPGMIPEN